jgi:pimeloyl-ACP methyl ester carboxylesterase
VLDQLALRSDADMERVAVAGHSAGAFTAFALAGMQMTDGTTLRDPRVKAIVPMSMPLMPGVVPPGGYDAIAIPILNVTGTCDTSLVYRTFPRHRRIPFESSRAPRQYLVTFERLTHDSFSAPKDPHHDAIAALTIAFLRATLGDAVDARAWFDEPGRGETLGTPVSVERKTGGAR